MWDIRLALELCTVFKANRKSMVMSSLPADTNDSYCKQPSGKQETDKNVKSGKNECKREALQATGWWGWSDCHNH